MVSKKITYKEFKEAIKISLEGDNAIVELYDPNVKVETIEDVVNSIYKKIHDLEDVCLLNGVYEKNKLVGYFVTCDKLLLSFSLNIKYRTRVYLRNLFKLIKIELGKEFFCRLWAKNKRAVKWLLKNKMEIVHIENNITHLIFR